MLDLDKILPLVQRPSRYINHEINSYKPDMENDVSICLCFRIDSVLHYKYISNYLKYEEGRVNSVIGKTNRRILVN